MELNAKGFYKKPRVLSGFKFLSHITETRKCGNRMPVYFPHRGTIDVIDYRLNPNDRFDCSVLFLAPLGKDDVLVENIEEWSFVQYRPNTQWTAIKIETEEEDDMMPLVIETIPARTYFKMLLNSIYGKNYFCVMIEGGNGNVYEATDVKVLGKTAQVLVAQNDDLVEKIILTDIDTLEFEYATTPDGKRGYYRYIRKGNPMSKTELSPIDFQDFYIKETFDNLKETVVLYDEQFYTVLGMRTNLAKPGNYSLYLKRWIYDCIRKVEIGPNQRFIYQKNSNSWLVDPVEALFTDFNDVKDQLRAEGVKKVIVAGVEKELKRVSEISSGLLHLVFAYDGELEHFYSTKNTRLRVREGKIATEYLLDHVKRMHV
jgi:hypothetical protein